MFFSYLPLVVCAELEAQEKNHQRNQDSRNGAAEGQQQQASPRTSCLAEDKVGLSRPNRKSSKWPVGCLTAEGKSERRSKAGWWEQGRWRPGRLKLWRTRGKTRQAWSLEERVSLCSQGSHSHDQEVKHDRCQQLRNLGAQVHQEGVMLAAAAESAEPILPVTPGELTAPVLES